jgi:hypothetical protein
MSTMYKPLALLLANVALALLAPDAGAAPADAPDCSLYSNAVLMSWPAQAPVWQFCWRRPVNSGPQPNGSAIELFDVFYNGHRVFDRLNAPIINVEYGPGGCGCFRDWTDQEVRFEAVGSPCGNGYCEVTDPAETVCDCAPTDTCDTNPNNQCNVDVGSFNGVAADKEADRLIMTTQMSAGWYRYTSAGRSIWTEHCSPSGASAPSRTAARTRRISITATIDSISTSTGRPMTKCSAKSSPTPARTATATASPTSSTTARR